MAARGRAMASLSPGCTLIIQSPGGPGQGDPSGYQLLVSVTSDLLPGQTKSICQTLSFYLAIFSLPFLLFIQSVLQLEILC